jgi:pantoate kinase
MPAKCVSLIPLEDLLPHGSLSVPVGGGLGAGSGSALFLVKSAESQLTCKVKVHTDRHNRAQSHACMTVDWGNSHSL